jgi:GTP-binding protein
VGRPNVGKSTLFNRLTGTRDALVADYPGLTRDRLYGIARMGDETAIVIDTGGLTGKSGALDEQMQHQVQLAVQEADVVMLMVDGDAGCTASDEYAAGLVRRSGKPAVLTVNKSEGRPAEEAIADFYRLGFAESIAISATRGDRVADLWRWALNQCAAGSGTAGIAPELDGTRVAVLGRPNVGKSTLINRYLGEDRVLTLDEAGTTRDSISIPFTRDARAFVLIDTAGIRRRSRVKQSIEKFSVVKALQSLEEADAVIVLIDAQEGLTEQDRSLIGLILERGRALTVGINKWDGLSAAQRGRVRAALDRQLPFLDFVDIHYVSALHGSEIVPLLESAARAADAAVSDLPTRRVNQVLQEAIAAHPPPVVRRHRVKLSYAHQGGKRPPTIVIHGNQVQHLPASYRRYLIREFRRAFHLIGTPIRVQLRSGRNPFAGRRNVLTPRQVRRRKRLKAHRQRRD